MVFPFRKEKKRKKDEKEGESFKISMSNGQPTLGGMFLNFFQFFLA